MESFHTLLLNWYDRHARVLPWRVAPSERKQGVLPNPYHVWLSEVMLQQTTVASVKSYFEKFITTWPTLADLAKADEEDVMRAWAGLGYYSRARNLKKCAELIASEYAGQFPTEQTELIKLPGIGDYTSAAIAAIAFGHRAEVVDGNIERVTTRYSANSTPLPKAKADCRTFMGNVTPNDRPGDFVQAMMDLGATICTPKKPACSLCPLSEDCLAHKTQSVLDFPVKPPKKTKPTRKGAAFVIERSDGSILLLKREKKGLLAGMTGLPTSNWTASKDGETGADAAPYACNWQQQGEIRHTFTHFHLQLEVWHTVNEQLPDKELPQNGWWSPPSELPQEALPTVMKKAIIAALPDAFAPNRK